MNFLEVYLIGCIICTYIGLNYFSFCYLTKENLFEHFDDLTNIVLFFLCSLLPCIILIPFVFIGNQIIHLHKKMMQ